MRNTKKTSVSAGSLLRGLVAIAATLVAACSSVPPQPWPPHGSTGLEMNASHSFVYQKVAIARKQSATGELRRELVDAAEKSHQPILEKRKTYSPPVKSAEIQDVGLVDSGNAVVTFAVESGYPKDYPVLNNSKFLYVYALYRQDGRWRVVASYQIFLAGVVSEGTRRWRVA